MKEIRNYIEENKHRFLNELFEFIRIPSVSADASHKSDMQKAAEFLKQHLMITGADKAEIFETQGHPIVFGEKIIDPKLPTVMVYGHYDVQPEGDPKLWTSPPFEPEIREEKIFARGADDDKGQLFMHLKAFEFMVNKNLLTTNMKFLLEGEEEVGSVNLGDFCQQHKELLAADIILVSDTGMIAQDIPSITVGLRGLAYMEVKITGPNRDLHSGLFGGAVANPANVLAKLIASLTDENNKITIPGFYDDVVIISEEQRALMAKAPFDLEAYKKALDILDISGENGYSTIERTGIRPCLDVNGMWSGYTEKGAKTILPSTAHAKISMRLVPNQDPEKIAILFQNHFEKLAPSAVKIEVEYLHGGDSYMAPTDNKAYLAASKAYKETFDKMPIPTRSGGSIPIIAMFDKVLGVKSILMGFGLESDAIHSPNENYPLFNFYKGIETIPYFYKFFVEENQD